MDFKDMKRQAVLDAIAKHDGNRTHAARSLGISVRTIQNLMKKYDMRKDFPPVYYRKREKLSG